MDPVLAKRLYMDPDGLLGIIQHMLKVIGQTTMMETPHVVKMIAMN